MKLKTGFLKIISDITKMILYIIMLSVFTVIVTKDFEKIGHENELQK